MARADNLRTPSLQLLSWSRLASTSSAHVTEHLYVGVVTVILPAMAAALGLTHAQVGLLVSARYLAAGLVNIPSGLLADFTKNRSSLLGACLVLLGLSSLLMSLASGFWPLLFFMAVAGVGAGGFHPQSLAILSAAYRDRRAFALGVHDSSGNLGEVLAPLSIGALLALMDWRSALQAWAVPGLAVGLFYALFCREGEVVIQKQKRLGSLLWKEVFSNRAVLAMFLVSVFRTMGQSALLTFLPLYLTRSLQLSFGAMSGYISLLFLFAGLAPSFSGWLSDRLGRFPLIVAGSLLSALALFVIPRLAPGMPLSVGLALVGIFLWALRPVVFAAAMEVTPRELAGTLVGFIFSGNMGLAFVAPIVTGFVADGYGLEVALPFIGIFPLLACAVALVPWGARPRAG